MASQLMELAAGLFKRNPIFYFAVVAPLVIIATLSAALFEVSKVQYCSCVGRTGSSDGDSSNVSTVWQPRYRLSNITFVEFNIASPLPVRYIPSLKVFSINGSKTLDLKGIRSICGVRYKLYNCLRKESPCDKGLEKLTEEEQRNLYANINVTVICIQMQKNRETCTLI